MDYNEIKTAAYGFADRKDTETLNRYDDFLTFVESKVNRVLKTIKMTQRATLPTITGRLYYGLPADFNGIRDIQINDSTSDSPVVTLKYLTPELMNEQNNISWQNGEIYYSIIADQFQIYPAQENNTIEIVYYQKVPPLTDVNLTNWLGDDNSDVYVYGLLVEISTFVKDAEAAALWSGRYTEALGELKNNDIDIRWGSGTPLQIRTI